MFIRPKLKKYAKLKKTKTLGTREKTQQVKPLKAPAGDLSLVLTPKSGSTQLPELQF